MPPTYIKEKTEIKFENKALFKYVCFTTQVWAKKSLHW